MIRTHQSKIELFFKALTAAIAVIWTGFALSYLIFGILGKTSEDAAWSYALALYASLSAAVIGVSLTILTRYKAIGSYLSSSATAALLGFFSTGWFTNESPIWAGVGAIAGGVLGAIGSYLTRKKRKYWQLIVYVALNAASAAVVYGFGLLIGTSAIALLSVGCSVAGICWSSVAAYSLWLTLKAASNTWFSAKK